MKLKEGFITYRTEEEQIMVSVTPKALNGIVKSNSTAAYIIDCLKEETSKEEIVKKMLEKYDVSGDTLEKDVEKVLSSLREIGAIDE